MPCPYKSRVTSDNFGVGKRHCRLLHRPHGRWFHRIGQWLNRIGRWLNRIGRSIYFTLPEIRRRQCRVPTNPGLHTTILRRRETALPCPPSPTRAIVIPDRPCDRYYALPEIRKRHCRVLLNPQLPKFNSTILPTADESFAQKPDRHCRNRTRMSLQSVQQLPAKIPNSDRTVKTADSKIFPVRADCCC